MRFRRTVPPDYPVDRPTIESRNRSIVVTAIGIATALSDPQDVEHVLGAVGTTPESKLTDAELLIGRTV
jgi:hypothetical protein